MSFEHVPPRKAFNNTPAISMVFEDYLRLGPNAKPRGPISQRGLGDYTLCGRCNNNTGSWYGGAYVKWCVQAKELLVKTGGKPTHQHSFHLYPLRVLKQVVSMFLSVNSVRFATKNPELRKFVLDTKARFLNPRYRFFVYYTTSETYRSMGVNAQLRGGGGILVCGGEISYPPFGLVMILDSAPLDDRHYEITCFSAFDYDDFRVLPLRIPVLPVVGGLPGDYRTRDQILGDAMEDFDFAGQ